MFRKRNLLCFLICCFSQGAFAEQIKVAVASNFAAAMNDIVAEFEQHSGHKVLLSFGSSGKFYAQIKNGAPFHVFFSADQAKPAALEKAGLVVADSRFTYASGTLALWSRKIDLTDRGSTIMRGGKFNKLALANPRLAPYGQAAVEVLENLQLKEITQDKWVQGENIAQTWQFVSTGNADIGFVALSQIMSEGKIVEGSAWIVPPPLHSPIDQDAVLLRKGENSEAARALLEFVRSDQSREIIEAYGYLTLTD